METEFYYFDVDSFKLVKNQAITKNEELDGSLLDFYYNNYLNVEGLKFPFEMVSKINDQTILTVTVNEVKLNKPISDAEFEP